HLRGWCRQGDFGFEPLTPGGENIALIDSPSDLREPGIESTGERKAIQPVSNALEDAAQTIGRRSRTAISPRAPPPATHPIFPSRQPKVYLHTTPAPNPRRPTNDLETRSRIARDGD